MAEPLAYNIPAITSTAVGIIVFGFFLLLAVHTVSAVITKNQSSDDGNLVVIALSLQDETIKLGDPLNVRVTLKNQGEKPITIPRGSLILKNNSWKGLLGSAYALHESALVRAGSSRDETFTVQPGQSVACLP